MVCVIIFPACLHAICVFPWKEVAFITLKSHILRPRKKRYFLVFFAQALIRFAVFCSLFQINSSNAALIPPVLI